MTPPNRLGKAARMPRLAEIPVVNTVNASARRMRRNIGRQRSDATRVSTLRARKVAARAHKSCSGSRPRRAGLLEREADTRISPLRGSRRAACVREENERRDAVFMPEEQALSESRQQRETRRGRSGGDFDRGRRGSKKRRDAKLVYAKAIDTQRQKRRMLCRRQKWTPKLEGFAEGKERERSEHRRSSNLFVPEVPTEKPEEKKRTAKRTRNLKPATRKKARRH
jgi:hypothetical protein